MAQTEKHLVNNLEKRRVAAGNNTAAIFTQIGAIPNDLHLLMIRLECLIDQTYGVLELDDDGRYVDGPVKRLEFEVYVGESTQLWAEQKRESYFEAVKKAQGGGLVLPGGHAASGLVVGDE